jgi:hypothetical protein
MKNPKLDKATLSNEGIRKIERRVSEASYQETLERLQKTHPELAREWQKERERRR